jgi:hypothetical protein
MIKDCKRLIRIKIKLAGDSFIQLHRQCDLTLLKNIRKVIRENQGNLFIIQPHISKPTDKTHTNAIRIFWVTIPLLSICEDRLVREKLLLFSFGRRGILHTTCKQNRLLKEEFWRRRHKFTKGGRNYTMTCTAFNLTPLSIILKQRKWGPGQTACIWNKEKTYKTYQNKKN